METFEGWIQRTGQKTRNVGAMALAKAAWDAAKAQSRNYVADDEFMPERVTFANGRIVTIQDNPDPNVPNGVYLSVGQLPD